MLVKLKLDGQLLYSFLTGLEKLEGAELNTKARYERAFFELFLLLTISNYNIYVAT